MFLYNRMGLSSTEDCSSPVIRDLRIVLLGKTGSGKSATGNTILGRKAFTSEISPSSVTVACEKETSHFNQRSVTVVDTPGVLDKFIEESHLKSELGSCITLSEPGPHIFLLVIRLDVRFTEEEKNAIKWIKDNFGEEASNYMLVLFTRGDELKGKSIQDYLDRSSELKEVISGFKDEYIVFDNTCMENRTQVADLFQKIDKIVQSNDNCYTISMYEEAQRKKNIKDRWSRWGGYLSATGNQLLVAATAITIPAAGGVATAEEALAASMRPMLIAGGAVISKGIGWWMKPKSGS